jgi:hypothetical protein
MWQAIVTGATGPVSCLLVSFTTFSLSDQTWLEDAKLGSFLGSDLTAM